MSQQGSVQAIIL